MGKDDPPTPPSPAAHFQYNRVPRDRIWALLFALTWAVCIGMGCYAVSHRNPTFITTDYTDPASCPYRHNGRALLEDPSGHGGDDPRTFSLPQFVHLTGAWLVVSALLALGLGAAFIHLFKHHSHTMTRVTIVSQIAIPAALAVLSLLTFNPMGVIVFGPVAALAALCFYWWRDQIDLATRLLGVAAHGLAANTGVITTTFLLNIASMVVISPLAVFIGFAIMNGEAVPNPQREGSAECVSPDGAKVLCCSWQNTPFSQAYMGIAVATILWTMLLANQIRVFVTSGAVAQWYFAPPSLCAPRGTTMLSLKHALGPSFGSLCFSSLVLTVSQMMRNAMENNRRNDNGVNILKLCLMCLAQCFWAIVEFLTKFATVMMAISGEAFLAAGRHVTDLLLRNMLDAFANTIWFTPMVIRLACFMLSSGWALLSAGAYYGLHYRSSAEVEATPGLNATILGVSTFVVTQFVLTFVGGILLSVLDAVFICWAIDRDSQTVSHPEVYAVLQTVPLPGAVVEQPDGGIAYGAGQQQQQRGDGGHNYQPPGITHV